MALDPLAVAVVPHLLWLGFLHASQWIEQNSRGIDYLYLSGALLIYTSHSLFHLTIKRSRTYFPFPLFIRILGILVVLSLPATQITLPYNEYST